MPQVITHKEHHYWFMATGIVGILLLTVGLGYWFWRYSLNDDNSEFQTKISLDNQLTAQSKYVPAAQLWINYAQQTPSKDHKTAAYVNAATDLINAKQYDDAITMCKYAEKVSGVTYVESTAAALAYRGAGDKQQAIHYYHEAIRLVPASQPDREAQIALYEQSIKTLGGDP
jgi:tetratricopeptide (TPR) repeat protein